jgi:hypothetical protein
MPGLFALTNPLGGVVNNVGGIPMTARLVRCVVFLLVALGFALPAQAEWIREFCRAVARDTKRRNCWPKPFTYPDRQAVREPFAVMISNGWRRQNLLADHHFDAESGQLTEAGRLKVQWIATEAPIAHRTVYVRTAQSAEMTAQRIASVQQYVAQVAPEGQMPGVQVTSLANTGWPAAWADAVGRSFESSMPEPRLPGRAGSGGGGSGN